MERAVGARKAQGWPVVQVLRRWMSGPQFFSALLLSAALNAMQLSSSLYLFHIYERVLPTGDRSDLVLSTGLLAGLFGIFALLDFLRARLLGRAGASFVRDLDRRSFEVAKLRPRDVDRARRFLARGGPAALFDALWLPVSFAGLSFIHPLLALYAFLGAALIAGIAVGSDVACRSKMCESADCKLAVAALAKAIRLMLQFGGIGFGALLVIEHAVSAGGLIAASVMMGRAFAVLDGALLHWRNFVAMARTLGVMIARSEKPAAPAAPDVAFGRLDLELFDAREGGAQSVRP
ncbi:hypothetical protein W911_05905 [Hyphomicrobium nitrativorans NL23]|uniref:ABC transmembrane type-1 domain-containing protein n=2 Tax=Hyphomicrobium TaxID=81 RepID=V5SIU7_9HYPH|nr:hypothetical protein W911_05905 [Hyphomicrobium nitrativorans NL23]